MVISLQHVKSRIDSRFSELELICPQKNPWIFLCLSALIDYLTRLANGKETYGKEYKKFIEDFFPNSYKDFEYKNGKKDLPLQMYHVLRCGIVHSFSLIPIPKARKKGGRDRSIGLIHAEDAEKEGLRHLQNYQNVRAPDVALFVAEDFMADTKNAASKLFQQASTNPSLEHNILTWFSKYPFISGEA